MNHLDHRRRLGYLAQRLLRNQPLTLAESKFLGGALSQISSGADANKVLGVARRRGQSDADALARKKLSMVMHWVACAITPVDDELPGLGYTLNKALEEAVKIARALFQVDGDQYDASYLRKCWYAKDKAHMHNVIRTDRDADLPY